MTWDVQIRAAQPYDSKTCAVIYAAGRARAFSWVDESRFHLSDYHRDVQGEEVWVAEAGGRVVGFASIWTLDNFLHHLYVAAGYERKGVGSALLEHVCKSLHGCVRLKCVVANRTALDFYRKRGWVEGETGEAALGTYVVLRTPRMVAREASA